MSKKVVNQIVKASAVATTLLFGIAVTAANITGANRAAISNELGQSIFEILDKNPDAKYFKSKYSKVGDVQKDARKLVEKIAEEGTVLLENKDNALPLAKDAKVTLLGYASEKPFYGGRGSSQSRYEGENIDLFTALSNNGFKVNEKVKDYYHAFDSGLSYTFQEIDTPWHAITDQLHPELAADKYTGIGDSEELLASLEEYGDAAIYSVARASGEGNDMKLSSTKDDLALNKGEKSILQGLSELKQQGKIKKVIVLLNSTNQIAQKEFEGFDIDAILWIGHPGSTGLNGVARVLNGDVNPSGHLSDTFWYDHKDNPTVKNFGQIYYQNKDQVSSQFDIAENRKKAMSSYLAYQEGVYLGYRYTETRYTDVMTNRPNAGEFDYDSIVYKPFGYGLSYSNFEFDNFSATKNADRTYTVKVDVTNNSDVAGKAVAQVYLQKPYTEMDIERHIEKPAVELVGFEKSPIIEAHQSKTLTTTVSEEDFTSYDAEVAKTYVITPGDYMLTVASDAHEAAKNFLAKNGVSAAKGDASMVASYTYELDEETYSVSRAESSLPEDLGKHVHKKVTNIFDNNNINKRADKGSNHIDFLTRSDWTKMPEVKLSLTQGMIDELNRQQGIDSIQPDDGKYPTYGAKNDLLLVDLINDKDNMDLWNKLLDQLTWQDTIALIQTGLRKTNLSGILGKPETKDHNGPTGITEPYTRGNGLAQENPNDPDNKKSPAKYPSIPVLASTFNKELAKEFGNMLGEDALWAGYNGFYGIGINTHRSPYEGRHFEYFSEDPLLAGTLAAEETKALQAKGCMAYIKHFALNDQETQRFGVACWSNEQALREISLKPFELAVIDGGAMSAMAAFSRIGLEFAPASKALQTDFLRGELGMKGLVVTDMYTLGYTHDQFPQLLMAGTDIPDGTVKTSVYQQFAHGYSEVAWQMREAARRVCYHTLCSNAMNGFDRDTKVIGITAPWENAVFAATTTIYVLFGISMAATAVVLVLNNKSKFKKTK